MDILHLIIILAVIGFAAWLLINYVPMPQPFKTVIMAICAIALIVFVLQWAGVGSMRLGH